MNEVLFHQEPLEHSTALGEAFLIPSDTLLGAAEIVRHFSSARTSADYVAQAQQLNGSWCYVSAPNQGSVYAIVDHRATRTLYYRLHAGCLLISENGYDLLQDGELGESMNTPYDVLLFFSHWGFTPEDATLHPDIRRIPAGTLIRFDTETGTVATMRYDSSLYEGEQLLDVDYEEAKSLFTDCLYRAMGRMIRRLRGCPVVLPLTAGRDSRLIALALQEWGMAPLYACTYGRTRDMHEVQRAGQIAGRLGFRHRFFCTVPQGYNASGYTQDEEALKYLQYISGLGSGYFFAEYTTAGAAAAEAPDAVVLPGHNGDVLGGDALFYRYFKGEGSVRRNARLLCFHQGGSRLLRRAEAERLACMHRDILSSYRAGLTPLEYFETFRNRNIEPKYYINSARGWRYFGLDVWMPFADKELCCFMHRLPVSYRIGKRLYEEVSDRLFQEAGIKYPDDVSEYAVWRRMSFRFKQYLRPYLIPYYVRRPRSIFTRQDPIGFKLLMQRDLQEQVRRYVPWQPTTVNGLSFAWWLWYNNCLPDGAYGG